MDRGVGGKRESRKHRKTRLTLGPDRLGKGASAGGEGSGSADKGERNNFTKHCGLG